MPGRWARRTLLQAATVGSVAAIAGCLGAVDGGTSDGEGTPNCPTSSGPGPYDAVIEVRPPDRPSDPRVTVRYDDLTADQQEQRTVRYGDLPADQQRLVDRFMEETGGDGKYRVCVAELSQSQYVTLEKFALRVRERYDIDVRNAVYLAYDGEVYAISVRIEDLDYAP